MKSEIAIVVALDQKRGIGKNGELPWPKIPEDMQRFKDETMGYPVIMGRKTYESIPPKFRPLPNRLNIVVTRDEDSTFPGCQVAHSIEEAIKVASSYNTPRICVVGGGEIYKAALPLADTLCLTHIEGDFNADTFFPEYQDQFPYQQKIRWASYQGINYSFEDLTRIPKKLS